jgi:hypothetical protein|tara:strand:- start:105 stop:470 length:366 start_codon:yes stop_codon:yes gene_type:complete
MFSHWLRALKARFEPRRVWVQDNVLHYSAGGKSWALPITEIVRVDAFRNIEPPSEKFGIVYSGGSTTITTVEDMDRFLAVFEEVATKLGLDPNQLPDDIVMGRTRNPIFERKDLAHRRNDG